MAAQGVNGQVAGQVGENIFVDPVLKIQPLDGDQVFVENVGNAGFHDLGGRLDLLIGMERDIRCGFLPVDICNAFLLQGGLDLAVQLPAGGGVGNLPQHQIADHRPVRNDGGGGLDQPGVAGIDDAFPGFAGGLKGGQVRAAALGKSFGRSPDLLAEADVPGGIVGH